MKAESMTWKYHNVSLLKNKSPDQPQYLHSRKISFYSSWLDDTLVRETEPMQIEIFQLELIVIMKVRSLFQYLEDQPMMYYSCKAGLSTALV